MEKILKAENITVTDFALDIQLQAERCLFELNEFLDEFGFINEPDAHKAVSYANGRDKTNEAKQSFLWFYSYGRILTMINIASDYAFKIKKMCEAEQA